MVYKKVWSGALWSMLFVVSGANAALPGGGTLLIENGKPYADIVIAETPTRTAKLAATELQTYLEKISGARLNIVTAPAPDLPAHFYVGCSQYTDQFQITDAGLKYGAFRMVTVKNGLVLIGNDAEFVIPACVAKNSGELPKAQEEWDERTGDFWQNPFWMDRMHRQYNAALGVSRYDEYGSFNAVCEFLRDLGVRWYMPGELGEIVPSLKTIRVSRMNRTVHPNFPYRNLGDYSPTFDGATLDAAMYVLHCGLQPFTGIPGPHGLCNVLGRKETKEGHPEFYNGHKTPNPDDHYYAACLSSQELVDYTVKYARKVFEIYPDLKYISVWPNDGFVFCSCPQCKGLDTPDRGRAGAASDYVWGFVERVASELYKTHPDCKVICGAYGVYTLAPEKIVKFSPNVAVGIVDSRARFADPEVQKQSMALRQSFQEKAAPGNICVYNHYRSSSSRLPCYFPHAIAADLRAWKGISQGEFIELAQGEGARGMHAPGFNHLNVYVTSRFYWDADQDVEAVLAEYYAKFYGPAARQMQAFIEYSEANWQRMNQEAEPGTRALALLAAARQAAGDSVYGQRIDLVIDYCRDPLTQLRDRLAKGRAQDLPALRGFRGVAAELKVDGRFDDPFWLPWNGTRGSFYNSHGSCAEIETGKTPYLATSFTVGWTDNSLVLKIRCAENGRGPLNCTAAKPDDMAIYDGDFVELLLETQIHSYYRIAVAPNGMITDSAVHAGAPDLNWSSKAQVATQVEDGCWCVEMRIPMDWDPAKAVDPLNGVAGYQPTTLYPFSLNLCRQRARSTGTERSAFSPTGTASFYELVKFGSLMVQ